MERVDAQTIRITKPSGVLVVRTDHPAGFDAVPKERTFNLVPGFECVPLTVSMFPGKGIRIRIRGCAWRSNYGARSPARTPQRIS